jgi:hypothetical protein
MSLVFRPREMGQLREAIAYGMLNLGYAIETGWKADAVVRGGHRSFNPGGRIGGNYRRSIHTIAFLDGRQVGGKSTDENGRALPRYSPGLGIKVYVGSNCGYGFFVDQGTRKMPARPAAIPAFNKARANAGALIAAGARKHLAVR